MKIADLVHVCWSRIVGLERKHKVAGFLQTSKLIGVLNMGGHVVVVRERSQPEGTSLARKYEVPGDDSELCVASQTEQPAFATPVSRRGPIAERIVRRGD